MRLIAEDQTQAFGGWHGNVAALLGVLPPRTALVFAFGRRLSVVVGQLGLVFRQPFNAQHFVDGVGVHTVAGFDDFVQNGTPLHAQRQFQAATGRCDQRRLGTTTARTWV